MTAEAAIIPTDLGVSIMPLMNVESPWTEVA